MASAIMHFREGVLAVAVGAGAGLAGSFLVGRHMWQRTAAVSDCIDTSTNNLRASRGLRPMQSVSVALAPVLEPRPLATSASRLSSLQEAVRVPSGFEVHLQRECDTGADTSLRQQLMSLR